MSEILSKITRVRVYLTQIVDGKEVEHFVLDKHNPEGLPPDAVSFTWDRPLDPVYSEDGMQVAGFVQKGPVVFSLRVVDRTNEGKRIS